MERIGARLRDCAGLRRRKHLLVDGLCAVLQLLLQRLRGRQLPQRNVLNDFELQVLGLHVRRRLVGSQRDRLHAVLHLRGRHQAQRRWLHNHGRRCLHKLHRRAVLSGARRNRLRDLPGDGGLRLARPRRPDDLRLQRDGGLWVEHGNEVLQRPVRRGRLLQLDGLRAVRELHLVRGRLLARRRDALHAHGQRRVRRLSGRHLLAGGRPRLHGLQR